MPFSQLNKQHELQKSGTFNGCSLKNINEKKSPSEVWHVTWNTADLAKQTDNLPSSAKFPKAMRHISVRAVLWEWMPSSFTRVGITPMLISWACNESAQTIETEKHKNKDRSHGGDYMTHVDQIFTDFFYKNIPASNAHLWKTQPVTSESDNKNYLFHVWLSYYGDKGKILASRNNHGHLL